MKMAYKKKNGSIVTDEWMDTVADAAEKGELPGSVTHTEVHLGRPRMYGDEELKTISFRLPASRIPAIEAAARQKGESRSDFIRDAVDKALISGA
jgi:hypothetical protein